MTKFQKGYAWKVGRSWYGRWYRDELDEQGNSVRVQHSEKLCEVSDVYRTKTDVLPLLAAKVRPQNERCAAAESTMTLRRYIEEKFLPYATRELKPSTASGYRDYFRMYLRHHASMPLRNCRCVTVTGILAAIHNENPDLNSRTLRHCKSLLSAVFVHAKRAGALDGVNPAEDAGIPRTARKPGATFAYSVQDVLTMLNVLSGIGRASVALIFFCGLRPCEARAAKWEDYDEKRRTLRVSRSMWRGHLTETKTEETEESPGLVPVAERLAEILAESPRTSEFILGTPSGKPIDLHNLAARVVARGLKRCAVCGQQKSKHAKAIAGWTSSGFSTITLAGRRTFEADHPFELDESLPRWRGWYALRRGLATEATSIDSALAAKGLLRHADLATTSKYYIKDVPPDAKRAMDKIDALFDNQSHDRPN